MLGLGRSLIAAAHLSILLFTSDDDLFPLGAECGGIRAVSPWCLDPAVARYGTITVLVLVISGYRPRWTCVPHWYVTFGFAASLVAPTGGEHLAKVVALLLVPVLLGDDRTWHWSLPSTPMAPHWHGAAAAGHLALRALVVSVYAQALLTKLAEPEWLTGTALHYVLQDPYFGATPAMAALLEPASSVLTWGTLVAEAFLALSPLGGRGVRVWAVATGFVLHTAIAVVLGLVAFGLTMVGLLLISALALPARRGNWVDDEPSPASPS